MKREILELVCLIDRSRSMYGREQAVLDRYHDLLGDYGKWAGNCYVTACLFSDRIDMLYLHSELSYVKPLRRGQYYVEGSTALFDAVGTMAARVEQCLGMLKDEIQKQVHVWVITDGIDNGSTQATQEDFMRLLREKISQGWRIRIVTPEGRLISADLWADKYGK